YPVSISRKWYETFKRESVELRGIGLKVGDNGLLRSAIIPETTLISKSVQEKMEILRVDIRVILMVVEGLEKLEKTTMCFKSSIEVRISVEF
ncbi:hypothetical protein A2U01_0027095, partial [Trifolium medium]|nr:hypothetical protein [Trifolium medium]